MVHHVLSLCVPVLAHSLAALGSPPVADLLRNVSAIDSGGNPASMVIWDRAEALVVAPDGRVFAAAAELGNGRIVALGHGGFIATDKADSEVFAANAIEWLAGGRVADGPIRVFGLPDAVAAELARRSVPHEPITGRAAELRFDHADVVIGSPQTFARIDRLDELENWLRAGGGMLVTETAWGSLQLNPGVTLDTLAANRLLQEAGIRFTGDSHSAYGPDGGYPVDMALLPGANADRALEVLSGDREGDTAFASRVAGDALSNAPLDSSLMANARRLTESRRESLNDVFRSMEHERLTPQKHPLARALIDLDSRLAMELPAEQVAEHPSSVAFPGPLGDQRAGDVTITLDRRLPGWRTTGLYAPPGEVVTVTVPQSAASAGLVVQIGAWRDPHSHPYRVRMKDAIRRFPIEGEITHVASAIGGPIYIDIPAAAGEERSAEPFIVEIRGSAAAPHYRSGVTDLDEWRDTIRHLPVPWAEFESDNLVLTVPSSAIRDVDRPDLVMDHWDRVHEAMQSLEPRTSNHWSDRQYRYVADVSVSWGYMYCPADAPIVIPASAAAAMFQLDNFDADGPNHLWGHYHEMGHAHQNPLWTDGATGEVTVNIFTVYALHKVNGYPLDSEVMRSDPAKAWKTFDAHRSSGRKFEEVGGPFERLQFYALLWHGFGFDAFRAAFNGVRAVPAAERPRNDTEERNLFLVHLSKSVGRDLSAYFDAWGIAVTDESREKLRDLPPWMPDAPGAPPGADHGG